MTSYCNKTVQSDHLPKTRNMNTRSTTWWTVWMKSQELIGFLTKLKPSASQNCFSALVFETCTSVSAVLVASSMLGESHETTLTSQMALVSSKPCEPIVTLYIDCSLY